MGISRRLGALFVAILPMTLARSPRSTHLGGTVLVQNTILALNSEGSPSLPSDCRGMITSQGHNLIGDTTGCTITLRATDLTGDPGFVRS
jgi:hypothetical protein